MCVRMKEGIRSIEEAKLDNPSRKKSLPIQSGDGLSPGCSFGRGCSKRHFGSGKDWTRCRWMKES
jgi:hypothetical protein